MGPGHPPVNWCRLTKPLGRGSVSLLGCQPFLEELFRRVDDYSYVVPEIAQNGGVDLVFLLLPA